jgi:hypothetical protein
MKKSYIAVLAVFVAMFLFAAPVAAQEPVEEPVVTEGPSDEAPVDEAPVEEPAPPDLNQISDTFWQVVLFAGAGFLLVITNRELFERIIAVPIVDGLLGGNEMARKLQPYAVVAVAIFLAWRANIDLWSVLGDMTNIVGKLPGDSPFIATGAIVGVLSMIWHEKQTGKA